MVRSRFRKKSHEFLVQKPQGLLHQRVQAVGPEHFGIASFDCAKRRSKFLLCDFYGNVLIAPTHVEHNQVALRAACAQVRGVMRARDLKDVIVAIESTGTYHRPVQDAYRSAGFETRLVHPFASKQFRQAADPSNKTDDTDLAAIFRAAVNGFGLVQPLWPERYLELQQLSRQRRDLVRKIIILRCQIKETLHQLLPGYTELFASHFFERPLALTLARATGSAQAIVDAGLPGLQQLVPPDVPHRMTTLIKILDWARTAAPTQQPQQLFRESLDRLSADFLEKSRDIRLLEQRSAHVLAQTPYVLLLAFPGISVVSATDLAGEQGPITHYANANHISGRAGLCPSRYQSDQVDRPNGPLRRRANRRLRAALMRIADNLIRHNHHYQARAQRWQGLLGKDPRWVHVKIAKNFSRLAFAILTGPRLFGHPACQPRHSITDKLLAFHSEHHTDVQRMLADIDVAWQQLPARARQQEKQMLQQQLDHPQLRRRRGPVAIGKIIPLVLARLGIRMVQSDSKGEDLD